MSWKRGLWSPHKLVAKSLMMFDDEKGDEDEIEDDEVHISHNKSRLLSS